MNRRDFIVSSAATVLMMLTGCTTTSLQEQPQKGPAAKETVYDKGVDEYDSVRKLAEDAENVPQTKENTLYTDPDPSNITKTDASWVHDDKYMEQCRNIAATIGSDTDMMAIVDRNLFRSIFLFNDDGSWKVAAGFDCGVGRTNKDLGSTDGDENESHTFTGIWKVDHINSQLGGIKWWVCYVPCWAEDGTDDGQAFHNLYLGYPGQQSHGCIRLSDENAKWVYDHLSVGSTVYVY